MMKAVEEENTCRGLPSCLGSGQRSPRVAMLAQPTIHIRQVQQWLFGNGNDCVHFASIRQFRESVLNEVFDVVIIDCDVSGDSVDSGILRWIRDALSTNIPILVFSQSDAEQDIVTALYSGADGFLVKPLRRNEFLARLHALLRRAYEGPELLVMNPYTIDLRNREVRNEGVVVHLTKLEYELTVFLFRNRGVVLSREKLLASVWRLPARLDARTVDTHICRLRTKLKIKSGHGWILSAVYQRGYCLRQHRIPFKSPCPAVTGGKYSTSVFC